MASLKNPRTAGRSTAAQTRLARGQSEFIALWGHMAGNWGVPRSMAEVHALLFIVGAPLNADSIMARLQISRGNASMTLRMLEEWGIVTRTHSREDRKDYFAAEQDVQTLFSTVICARKRREIDPLLDRLTACRALTDTPAANDASDASDPDDGADAAHLQAHNRKLDDMLECVRAFDALTTRFLHGGGGGGGLDAVLTALRAMA